MTNEQRSDRAYRAVLAYYGEDITSGILTLLGDLVCLASQYALTPGVRTFYLSWDSYGGDIAGGPVGREFYSTEAERNELLACYMVSHFRRTSSEYAPDNLPLLFAAFDTGRFDQVLMVWESSQEAFQESAGTVYDWGTQTVAGEFVA